MTDNLQQVFNFVTNEHVRQKLNLSADRIRRSFDEMFSGYQLKAEDVLNEVIQVERYTGLVSVHDINFYSVCEHHFAPFFGTVSVTYQPGKIITGLGKIVRLVHDVHARRLQLQETMTRDIAEDVVRVLDAAGARVVSRAKHLCMCSRGPKDDNALTTVVYGCGTLQSVSLEFQDGIQ